MPCVKRFTAGDECMYAHKCVRVLWLDAEIGGEQTYRIEFVDTGNRITASDTELKTVPALVAMKEAVSGQVEG